MNTKLFPILLLVAAPFVAEAELRLPAPEITPEDFTLNAERTALPIAVDVSPLTHGDWSADGRSWALEISSEGAQALHLGFSELTLPAGSTLSLSSSGGTKHSWPAVALSNVRWLPAALGDSVTLTIDKQSAADTLGLRIFQVNYGYKSQNSLQKAGSCQVNVSCDEGDGWRDEIQSVMRIDYVSDHDGNSYNCTGVLLNNTAADATPYVLTAEHCINSANEAQSVVVYWNYQLSSCGGAERPADTSLDGVQMTSSLVASWEGSDFSLLRLNQEPNEVDPSNDVHYAGWDRRNVAPSSGVTIHHPSASSKKISYEYDALRITELGADRASFDANFLRVADWDIGTTEAGSSGGGLWDGNRRVVGQLFGGAASCSNDEPDWYGRLASSWNGGGTPTSRLSDWLDPVATGAECLNGDEPDTMASFRIETDCNVQSGGKRNPSGADEGLPDASNGGGGGAPWGVIPLLLGLMWLRRFRA